MGTVWGGPHPALCQPRAAGAWGDAGPTVRPARRRGRPMGSGGHSRTSALDRRVKLSCGRAPAPRCPSLSPGAQCRILAPKGGGTFRRPAAWWHTARHGGRSTGSRAGPATGGRQRGDAGVRAPSPLIKLLNLLCGCGHTRLRPGKPALSLPPGPGRRLQAGAISRPLFFSLGSEPRPPALLSRVPRPPFTLSFEPGSCQVA